MQPILCTLGFALLLPTSAGAQIVCPTGVDCTPQPWTANQIRLAAQELAGCWSFELGDRQALSSPISATKYAFPLVPSVELTRAETADVWPDFEDIRHELAFRVRFAESRHTAYWIPRPDSTGFVIKWLDVDSEAGHIVLNASVKGSEATAAVSIPGHHIAIILRPYDITARRCT